MRQEECGLGAQAFGRVSRDPDHLGQGGLVGLHKLVGLCPGRLRGRMGERQLVDGVQQHGRLPIDFSRRGAEPEQGGVRAGRRRECLARIGQHNGAGKGGTARGGEDGASELATRGRDNASRGMGVGSLGHGSDLCLGLGRVRGWRHSPGRCSLWNGAKGVTLCAMTASEKVTKGAVTPPQSRAARGLLDWSRDQLAASSGVAKRTIVRFEASEGETREATLAAIRTALEAAGVDFIEENGGGPGVRLKSSISS